MNIAAQPVPLMNSPRPFKEISGLWLRLGHMTEAFFQDEVSHASAANTIYSVLIYTAFSTLLAVVQSLLGGIISFFSAPTATRQAELPTIIGTTTIFLCCFGLIMTPISFYLNNGITFVGAQVFGGKGKFNSQAYLSSLFFVPLGLIATVASFISLVPKVGLYVFSAVLLAVAIFNVVLTVRSFKVVHNLSTGRAVAAVLLSLALLLIPICIIAVLMLMGPVIGNVFSQINSEFGTPMP